MASLAFPFLFSIFPLITATLALPFLFFSFLLIRATLANKKYEFDLFISHRGPDAKMTCASCLYHCLRSHGLQVFVDYQELVQGLNISPQIKEAIASASLHVVIFSPGYADSTWCLEELHLILESGKPMIPIFYKVKPADLKRSQENNGPYAEALKEHELRLNPTIVREWRNDLSRAADICGFDLDALKGDEGALMDKVVKLVLNSVGIPILVRAILRKCIELVSLPRRGIEGFNGGTEGDEGAVMDKVGKLVLNSVETPILVRAFRRECIELLSLRRRGTEGFNGGTEEFNDLRHAMKKIVLHSSFVECNKCKRRAMERIAGVEGVDSVTLDEKEMKVTVIGSADPVRVVAPLREIGFAELLSVGPVQENSPPRGDWLRFSDRLRFSPNQSRFN